MSNLVHPEGLRFRARGALQGSWELGPHSESCVRPVCTHPHSKDAGTVHTESEMPKKYLC